LKWIGQRVKKQWPKAALGLDGSESGLAALVARADVRRGVIPPHPDWLRSQALENLRLGATAPLEAKVAEVAAGRGVTVIAGQQVALHGGPLYSVYKLISAVVLAERLEAELGLPVLPVFWSVSDDSDFGEVSSTWLARPEGRLIKLRDEETPPSGTRIGTLSSQRQDNAIREHMSMLAQLPFGASVLERLAAIETKATNWQEFQTTLFHRLLPEREFLVVDGGDPELLELVDPWLRRVGQADSLREDLAAGAEASRSLDLEPSFEPDLAERALFRIEGDLRLAVEGDPNLASGPLAPNVVLRPLLQDYVLPNVATVCGPSEIRYRAQLGPVYAKRNIPEPLRVPRYSAVLAPTLREERASRDLAGYSSLLDEPKQFVKAQIESEAAPAAQTALVETREDVRARVAGLLSELEEIDKSLPQLITSAAGKADYQFERMLEGIRGKQRQQLLKREPILAALADWVRPREREQERVLSALMPVWLEGWGAFEPIVESAAGNLEPFLSGKPDECQEVFLLDSFSSEDAS